MKTNINYQHAIVLLIKQMMDQVDEIASLRKQGNSAALSRQLLKEMSAILPELSSEQQEIYFETFIKLTQNISVESFASYSADYAEYSANSKRRLLSKIRSDLKLAANN